MFSAAESAWYNAGVYLNSDIYCYIKESTGNLSVWHFTNCAIKLDDSGSWAGDKDVKQKISFKAQARVQLA
jgi:hypothetical protein